MLQRTAKSCGPDAPTLASSSRSCVGPTGLRQNLSVDDGGKQARSPGRARRKPLKPLRAGTSGDSGVLVVTRVRSTTTKCTRGRGCNGHPAFPTPSEGGRYSKASGASRGEVANVCLGVRVFSRHCEPTGRANARPMTGSAKQSILSLRQDGLLRCARNDVLLWLFENCIRARHTLSRHRPPTGRPNGRPAFYHYQVHTRPRVQRASGVPHALFRAEASSTPRAHGAARSRTCV
jgi:hypothetical protein